MLSEARWDMERRILLEKFPWFLPFETASEHIGFCGELRGPRSKRLFQVLMKIPAQLYPEVEPPLYLDPKLTFLWWRPDDVNGRPGGRLCYHRKERGRWTEVHWNPALNTFANVLQFAVQYLQEFDK